MGKDTAKVPLYKKIVTDYKNRIISRELHPNDPIPTQTDLAKLYNTSEITSRRALSELVNEGLIYRVRRKGTFVKEGAEVKALQMPEQKLKKIYFAHPNAKMRIFTQGFYTKMLQGIQQTCKEHNVDFGIWDLGASLELSEESDCGYVLITDLPGVKTNYMDALQKWKDSNQRIVTVQFRYPHLHIPYVIGDNLTGGYLAVQHLLSLGHTRIGIILTGKSQIDINEEFSMRLQGYRLALSNYNIDFDPKLVCVMEGAQEDEAMGYEGFNDLMSLEKPPTAIFVTSDYKALGAMNAARDCGLLVPQDISIIGYDGEDFTQHTVPSLSTVDQNVNQFGRRAAELLILEWKENIEFDMLMDLVVPTLVVRSSSTGVISSKS